MPEEKKKEAAEKTPEVFRAIEWTAPGRPFRKRTKQFYLTAILIVLLVEIIAFLFSQYLLMIVTLSLVFVAFVLATVPPKDFHYRISSEGITIEDRFFLWQELYDFYLKTVDGVETIHIRTESYFPGELVITLGDMKANAIRDVIINFLPFREYVKPTFMEKAGDWLAKNFPLENK
jgi:hypothetical protein